MDFVKRILKTQPILFVRVITSVAAVAVAFGVPITDADLNSTVEAVTTAFAAGNILLAMLDRQLVFSPATHEKEVAAAEGRANGDYQ